METTTFFDDVEALSFEEYRDHASERFLEQFQYVTSKSPFYREKLADHGVDTDSIASLEDIAALPFTMKEELRRSQQASPPFGSHRACPLADVARVYTSSGTTGRPTFIGLTDNDIDMMTAVGARAAYASGLRSSDIVIGAIAGGPFMAALVYDAYRVLGATVAPVGPGNTDRILTLFQNDCGTVLSGTPSYAEYFLDQVREQGIDPEDLGVEKILVGGEPLVEEVRREVEEAFGCTMSQTMGNSDMCMSIWAECDERNGMHFTGHDAVFPELINPTTGAVLDWTVGTQGELVYTALDRACLPLVRFRTHDRVRVATEACGCGRSSPTITALGRTDDMFIVRGVNIYPNAVKDVVKQVDGTSGHIQIRLENESGPAEEAPVAVSVELDSGVTPTDALRARIEERLREQLKFKAEVELLDEGTLDREEYKTELVEYE
jgi:phenylacetate-CoA ligase